MKAAVDEDRCRGHGVCNALCPEVFTLTDDGYAEVRVPQVPAEFEETVRTAVGQCPERAITVS
ncbi:ferredoxin [Actinomadura craniellae]|uniref:Ferredoxin n=1 Tax=Actinomadura craniellae TaxID=2231787 RepID=A0A365HDG7_9ACTN|nr:ferredoxin [Actinomadura craniellae]RAY16303.1 ferredoxin [Actinomadura craniellae]